MRRTILNVLVGRRFSRVPFFFFTAFSLTSVFLASKTEEQITNVNNLAKATGLDDLQILGKELTLLQARTKKNETPRYDIDGASVAAGERGRSFFLLV